MVKNSNGIEINVARVAGNSGSEASTISNYQALQRATLACMLGEDIAYESGQSVIDNIKELVPLVPAGQVFALAKEIRNHQHIRHTPLLLATEMLKHPIHKQLVGELLFEIIQRPDELVKAIEIYWKDGKKPLANQLKKGLAKAFGRFNEYSLAKYDNNNSPIKLRDILFLCHAKPKNRDQENLWYRLINKLLDTPDTWEVELSSNKVSKKDAWTRLLSEKKLGAMALLKNLRNMIQADVSETLIREALTNCKADRVLPFRFISAAKEAPLFKRELEALMFRCLETHEKLPGKTVVIVDVSGSMGHQMSGKSLATRQETAEALAMLIKEVSEKCVVYATAGSDYKRIHSTKAMPNVRGFDLQKEIEKAAIGKNNLGGGGIFLKQCVDYVASQEKTCDTLIVISDSQDTSGDESPKHVVPFGKYNYEMDISCHKHGIAYNKFTVLNGFSENLVEYVLADRVLNCKE